MGSSASALRVAKTHPEGEAPPQQKRIFFLKGRSTSSKSKAIDKALSKDAEADANKFKILLLGGSECGKTTIFKQMRVLHLDGFNKEHALNYRSVIHSNALEALSQLIEAANKMTYRHELSVQEDIHRVMEFKEKESATDIEQLIIPFPIGRCMERIWQSSTIQNVYERRFSYNLLDSAKYFLDEICRITEDVYMPTTQDILHSRFRTTGLNELSFTYKKMEFKMVDVGGQRTERRKWIHCFDNVDMILFVASMSDYDLSDPEDETMNRMMQNFEIFRTVCCSDFFKQASIVLFLNKYDIFLEKLTNHPLNRCWKTYEGDNSPSDATEFVQKQFRRCVKNKQKYFNFTTTATDTNNIDLVFGSAVAHIVNENLRSTGLHE